MTHVGILLFLILPSLAAAWVLSCVVREYRKDRVPVLLYHRLIRRVQHARPDEADDEMIWATFDDSFAEQMEYLKREGYQTLDLSDYFMIRAGKSPLPRKPVIITFDDGYASNYSLAYPVLRRCGFKATIYVVLEPEAHTRELVRGVDGFLSKQQMRELSENGISIQSHTLSHRMLTELSDEEVFVELTESRRRIAEITGRPVDHLAIPRAAYSRRIRRLAKAAGYRTVCCNNKGSATGLSNLLAIPRIVVERDVTIAEFGRNLLPSAGVILRIVGNLKRIPERIGGPRFAYGLRQILYASPLRPWLTPNALPWILLAGVICYAAAAVWFWVRLAS